MIELRALTRSYKEGDSEHIVLQGAHASVRQGVFAVSVGRSGSGKSSLLNLISGIDLPREGEVIIDGPGSGRHGGIPQPS